MQETAAAAAQGMGVAERPRRQAAQSSRGQRDSDASPLGSNYEGGMLESDGEEDPEWRPGQRRAGPVGAAQPPGRRRRHG